MLSSFVRYVTRIEPSDKTSRTPAGNAAYRQFILQVYLVEFSILLGAYTFTNTRTEEGFVAGYRADSMLKLLSSDAKAS